MSKEHIADAAEKLLGQFNWMATGYIVAVLDEARRQAIELSVFKPYGPPPPETSELAAKVFQEAEKLLR